MIEGIQDPQIETLLILAEADESTLQYPLPDHIFGFHAQQSVEKMLKALISAHGRSYPFTHDLDKLAELLGGCGEELPSLPFDVLELEPFAVLFRYDLGSSFSAEERVAVRESLVLLRQHVLARIMQVQAE